MDIEEVAAKHPEKIHRLVVDPATGIKDAEADDIARKIGIPRSERAAGAGRAAGAVPRVLGNRLVAGRDQPADPDRRRARGRARRQDELRRQRALPPSRGGRDARPRRGGPGRGRGVEVRPQLHPARRQHRLPGERRRARDGDDGHHQVLRRRAGELPRRGRRRDHREGDRGVQDHAAQPDARGDPGQHLRRHHEVRRDRDRARRGGEGGEPQGAARRAARGHQRRARQEDPRRVGPADHLGARTWATRRRRSSRRRRASSGDRHVDPDQSQHQGRHPGHHRQDRPVPHPDVPRLREREELLRRRREPEEGGRGLRGHPDLRQRGGGEGEDRRNTSR